MAGVTECVLIPTATPTFAPSPSPTATPTASPTAQPTPAPTASPTAAVLIPAPVVPENSATAAPTPAPTPVAAAGLHAGALCLAACEGSAPAAASTECGYFSYALNACPSFTGCNATEARTVKDRCLAQGTCSNAQCGVPSTVAVVETPKAAVATSMRMTGVSAEALAADSNLQLALRGGVASSLGVTVAGVKITSVTAAAQRRLGVDDDSLRRLSSGVNVAFEVAIPTADVGAVAAMSEKVATQAATFATFVQAEAAALGVLDALQDLEIDSSGITTAQATTKSLPTSFSPTTQLSASELPTWAPTPTPAAPAVVPSGAGSSAGVSAAAVVGVAVGVVALAGLSLWASKKKKSASIGVYEVDFDDVAV